MAFYKDYGNNKNREDKRRSAEQKGGFEDEGARYNGQNNFGKEQPRGGRPPQRSGGNRFDSRPPREGGNRFENRPPREGGNHFDSRPPREGGNRFDSRPPREGGNRFESRPPREGGNHFDSRPPREGGNRFESRPPREGGNRFESRPPREGGNRFDSRPPREGGNRFESRPPREGGNRFESRPPREGGNRFDSRPPREGGNRFDSRPPREGGNRGPREGGFRFTNSVQQPYRSRGSELTPRSYDEQRRDRREAPAPAAKDYASFRYEAPPSAMYDAPGAAEEEIVPNENLLSGRNPIREALKSGRDIEKMLVARGELSGSAREIIAMAKEQRVPVQEVDRARLDAITPNHQGMLAFASAYQYHTVDEMLALAKERNQAPFLVILDGVTDPHNLGAIIRTAECAGAHGVIVQERRAVGLTPAAVKASAGAIEHIMVARVVNLASTLEMLKQQNIWTYAADMGGEDYLSVDYTGGVAIVVGAEGDGVSRLVQQNCDKRVSLPIRGKLDSLNASVAAGILLYAVLRSR